jgi:predicted nuclease of restriction endonuclease-like RecB superfamily
MHVCKFCLKECKNPNSLRNHERLCPQNKDRNYVSQTLGKPAWNRGLTKETSEIVKSLSEKISKTMTGRTGHKHSEETKQKISEQRSINNKGGRSKWFEIAGQRVQGTWELNVALKFEEHEIRWIKLKTGKDILKYEMHGKIRSYTPDFYLPDFDLYIEIKGYWWGDDKEKMKIVMEKYPDRKIIIVEKEEYENILKDNFPW